MKVSISKNTGFNDKTNDRLQVINAETGEPVATIENAIVAKGKIIPNYKYFF